VGTHQAAPRQLWRNRAGVTSEVQVHALIRASEVTTVRKTFMHASEVHVQAAGIQLLILRLTFEGVDGGTEMLREIALIIAVIRFIYATPTPSSR
jgi:hypothetical protein